MTERGVIKGNFYKWTSSSSTKCEKNGVTGISLKKSTFIFLILAVGCAASVVLLMVEKTKLGRIDKTNEGKL